MHRAALLVGIVVPNNLLRVRGLPKLLRRTGFIMYIKFDSEHLLGHGPDLCTMYMVVLLSQLIVERTGSLPSRQYAQPAPGDPDNVDKHTVHTRN